MQEEKKERTYPCEATVIPTEGFGFRGFPGLGGTKITVLTRNEYYKACDCIGHRVELPEGFPEPPEHCGTWIMDSINLVFED